MKSLIITWENFQDQEVVYPYYRALEESTHHEDVHIAANVTGRFFGIMGVNMTSHKLISQLFSGDQISSTLNAYDLLIIPGGVKALEKLRQEASVITFIKEWNALGKVIASTCHGAQLLISARVTRGRTVSGYYSIKDDIENSGAVYSAEPVVVSDNLVTSPHYDFMAEWMSAAIARAQAKK
jgi:protease I